MSVNKMLNMLLTSLELLEWVTQIYIELNDPWFEIIWVLSMCQYYEKGRLN